VMWAEPFFVTGRSLTFVTGAEPVFRDVGGAFFVTGRSLSFVTGAEPVFRDGGGACLS